MKKFFLILITFCLALVRISAQEAAAIYVEQEVVKAKQGSQLTLPLNMRNSTDINAWNFYLDLPEGLTYLSHSIGRSDGHQCDKPIETATDDLMFACFSMKNNAFTGTDGEIASIVLNVADDMPLGKTKVILTKVNFSDMESNSVIQNDYVIPIEVFTYYAISAASADAMMGTVEMTGGGAETENGTSVTVKAIPGEGYEFVNWTSGDTEVSTQAEYTFDAEANLALVAHFKPLKYDITFVVDDVKTSMTLDYGSLIIQPETPTKEGYTFAGWDPELKEGATVPIGGTTYTATWTINSHTITFNTNGGSEMAPITLEYGATITLPQSPTREGYEFTGWEVEVPQTMPDRDLVLNATWKILQYTVKFVVDDQVVYEATLDYGSSINQPADPTKEGYTFVGWSPKVVETVPAQDVTFVAQFSVNSYKLTYYLDGEVVLTQEVEYGATITPYTPEVAGNRKFDGWQEEVPTVMPAHDVDIHGTTSEIIPDSIETIVAASQDETDIYDLQGRLVIKKADAGQLSRLPSGIYIINGMKYLKK